MTGSGEVESTEYDLPRKIHGVPELRVAESKSNHVLPHFFDVCSVSC